MVARAVGGSSPLLGGILRQVLRQHQPRLIPTLDSVTRELVRPRSSPDLLSLPPDPSPTCGPASREAINIERNTARWEGPCLAGGSHSKQEAEAGPGLAVVQAAQPQTLAVVGSAQAGLPCGLSQWPARPSRRLLLTCDNRCLFSWGHLPGGLMFNSLQPWSCRRGRWVVRPQASAGPKAFCPSPRQEWALALGR